MSVKEKGRLMLFAETIERVKEFKDQRAMVETAGDPKGKDFRDGRKLVAYHRSGTSTGTQGGLMDEAAYHIIGSVMYKDDVEIARSELIQIMSADASVIWGYGIGDPETGLVHYKLKCGIGRFKHIRGTIAETVRTDRADSVTAYDCEVEYSIDPANDNYDQYLRHEELYTYHDKGYSFHNDHVADGLISFKDADLSFGLNHQDGVILSQNENSPRHDVTCFDRGVQVQTKNADRCYADIMLLEDCDVDGDMLWIYHEWWYGVTPGFYEIFGGTGKWKGIHGSGMWTGDEKMRFDDHWMPTWALSWDL